MGNRTTKEVIDGVSVIRFNGNNLTSGTRYAQAEVPGKGLRKAPRWVQAKAWAAKKAKEDDYRRRYLGG